MRLNLPLLALIFIAFAASLLAGRVWLPPPSLLSPPDSLAGLILYDVRLPRSVLALLTGAVVGALWGALPGWLRQPTARLR